jgi:uncharacterized protein YrrD
MLLRDGTNIETTDGRFGSLTDVVVDPHEQSVTHLVISPDGDLQQARVVPLWLTTEVAGGIRVELDSPHALQLQQEFPGDFLRVETPKKATGHDLRFRSVLRRPFAVDADFNAEEDLSARRTHIDEVEIRCDSRVISTNDRDLGHVVGFLTSDDLVHAFVVRSGLLGFTHDVIVPLTAIAEVTGDMIVLDIDRHQFRTMRRTEVFAEHRSFDGVAEVARHSAARTWYSVRDRVVERLN